MLLRQRPKMVHSVLTSPDSNGCRNQCWITASWGSQDSRSWFRQPSDFRMTTILDLVRAKKNSQNSTTAIRKISTKHSKRVTVITAKSPSTRVKSDHDDSIHRPGQSLTAPGTSSTSVASVGSTISCDNTLGFWWIRLSLMYSVVWRRRVAL